MLVASRRRSYIRSLRIVLVAATLSVSVHLVAATATASAGSDNYPCSVPSSDYYACYDDIDVPAYYVHHMYEIAGAAFASSHTLSLVDYCDQSGCPRSMLFYNLEAYSANGSYVYACAGGGACSPSKDTEYLGLGTVANADADSAYLNASESF